MKSSFSVEFVPLSTPLTTAPRITGRICSNDLSTSILISPCLISSPGESMAELRKDLAALEIVS